MADKNYIIEKTEKGTELIRNNLGKLGLKKITYFPGLSAADYENINRPREREEFLEKFLNPMIQEGKIGDGIKTKFDDRKFRFHSALVNGENLELKLGITYYQECANCRKLDNEKRMNLIDEGKKRFNEPYAFFTKGCGIGVTPITANGSIFLGKRKVQSESSGYSGELSAINGWVDYQENLDNVNFSKDVLREMKEEFGISKKDINKLIFAGIFSASSMADSDFVYLAWTNLPDEFFSNSKYKEIRKDEEHGELIKVAGYKDMKRLLETGEVSGYQGKFNILYSLRASLEQIKPGEMAD